MGTNYHTAWAASVTQFAAASMNPALAALDKGITYGTKRPIVHCAGNITWAGGILTWSGTITIVFNREDGQAIANTIAAGSKAIADNEFAYVTLSETNNAVLTVSVAAITTGAASNFLTLGILVLAYRNTTNNELYPVALAPKWSEGRYLEAREQALTCADAVTIDWSLGATARMTFDRATVAFTLSGGVNGQVYRLLLVQDGTGGRTATWATAVKWAGGAAPTLTAGGNAEDIITFVQINGSWYASASLAFAVPA